MASTGVNVLRWSALAAGVFYGFTRQTSITARDKAAAEKAEWDSKVKAIEDAKKAYKEKTQPKTSSVITDPMDPKFDLEAYLGTIKA